MNGEELTIFGEPDTVEFLYQSGVHMRLTSADIARFWEKVSKAPHPKGCWEWQAAQFRCGRYGAFRAGGQTLRAHRIAYFLTKGNLDPNLEILHLCSNPKCCNPDHLEQNTHAANLKQAGAEGKMARHVGANAKIKFSEETLRDILTSRLSLRALGRKYKVDHKTIASIRKEFSLCSQE